MRLIVLMITLAAVMTGVNAEAQRREYRSERSSTKYEKGHRAERKSQRREYQKPDRDKKWKNDRGYHADQYAKSNKKDYGKSHNYSKQYHKKHYDNHYRYDKRYEYRHPKYGHVYKKFRSKPVRIHHHHGDYYFHSGHYYRHHPRIGYVRIEFPRHLVFASLPFHCELVRVGPHVYYRYGDLYFERFEHGFRLAPSVNIHLSAHF